MDNDPKDVLETITILLSLLTYFTEYLSQV